MNTDKVKYRKALYIGINYTRNKDSHLENCINDALDIKTLFEQRNVVEESRLLIDANNIPNHQLPTKENIIKCFNWLFDGVNEGDNLFIHYSGHGGSVVDRTGKEKDGKNETLCNLDYPVVGEIVDDELNQLLVKPAIELGVHLFMITDCCHSGSNCDERFSMKEAKQQQPFPGQPQQYPGYPQPQQPFPGQPQLMYPAYPQQQPQYPSYPQQQQYPGYPQQQQYTAYPPQQQMVPFQAPQKPASYVIFNNKLYNAAVFYKRHVEPIEKAYEEINEYNMLKEQLKLSEQELLMVHPRDRKTFKERNRNASFFNRLNKLKKKMEEYYDSVNPYIKLILKTNTLQLPKFEEVKHEFSLTVDEMRSNRSTKRGMLMNPPQQMLLMNRSVVPVTSRSMFKNPFQTMQFPTQMVQFSNQVVQIPTQMVQFSNQINTYMQNVSQNAMQLWNSMPQPTSRNTQALSRYVDRAEDVKWTYEEDTNMKRYTGKGTFIKLSGCKDDQTSADGFVHRENGAMTGCIITFFQQHPGKATIGNFLFNIRKMLQSNRFEQIPQMGSNDILDSNTELLF